MLGFGGGEYGGADMTYGLSSQRVNPYRHR